METGKCTGPYRLGCSYLVTDLYGLGYSYFLFLVLALTLQSESELVFSRLSIPCTHFDLQYVRPDFIMLRVIARNLIMWSRYVVFEEDPNVSVLLLSNILN